MGSQTVEKVFTEKRLELTMVMGHREFGSISELANHLGRDIKNIYEDLHILRRAGIVRLVKTGRNVQPKLLIDGISLIFR
jgi:predicted transcriptional regulator